MIGSFGWQNDAVYICVQGCTCRGTACYATNSIPTGRWRIHRGRDLVGGGEFAAEGHQQQVAAQVGIDVFVLRSTPKYLTA